LTRLRLEQLSATLPERHLLRRLQQLMAEALAEVDIKATKEHSVTVPLAAQTIEESLLMMVAERIAPSELVALMRAVEDEALEENVKWTDIVALLGVNLRSKLAMAGAQMKVEPSLMMSRLEKPLPRLIKRKL